MDSANDAYGAVYERSTAVFLARLVGGAGQEVQASDITSIAYTVAQVDSAGQSVVVPGHDSVSLSVDDVVYDTLQLGANWTVDATGYNFRHEIDIDQHPAFPTVGGVYHVRYELSPAEGQPIVVRFEVRAI